MTQRHPGKPDQRVIHELALDRGSNLFQEKNQSNDKSSYSAYWSLENGNVCHGGQPYAARRTGNVYQGDHFKFEWAKSR